MIFQFKTKQADKVDFRGGTNYSVLARPKFSKKKLFAYTVCVCRQSVSTSLATWTKNWEVKRKAHRQSHHQLTGRICKNKIKVPIFYVTLIHISQIFEPFCGVLWLIDSVHCIKWRMLLDYSALCFINFENIDWF